MNTPTTMRALQLNEYLSDLEQAINSLHVVEKPIPKPGPGQVLIRMEAAPCNPSDLMFLINKYGISKTLPTVPGFEGAGTVVESGGGFLSWWLKGKRVACAGQSDSDGTWSQYFVTEAKNCIPLRDEISFEQGASFIINPLTAYGMVEEAIQGKHAALVQTAAASQLGRMVIHLASRANIATINVVRRQEQADLLKSLGADVVLNSEDDDFYKQLKTESERLKATLALEAVGGSLTGTIFDALPQKSTVLVYGALSEESCNEISPLGLIFEEKKVLGFWLNGWIKRKGTLGILAASRNVQKLMAEGVIKTAIHKKVSLDDAPSALLDYPHQMTQGKILIAPNP